MKYVLYDYEKLRNDVNRANKEMNDDIALSKRLDDYGIGNYCFANSLKDYERNSQKHELDKYEPCNKIGRMLKLKYNSICSIFGLNAEDYLLKEKRKVSDKETEEHIENALCGRMTLQKLDELMVTINKLGNIEMQNMEYLKKIADGIQTMNDKYNKPSAYIRK